LGARAHAKSRSDTIHFRRFDERAGMIFIYARLLRR
jgi:hypothetical protein